MGKTAFIFPGQGSQYVGMGRELYESHDEVRRLYLRASEVSGLDIAGVSFEGPAGELSADLTAQLAVYTCNESYSTALMKAGVRPDAVTGYSMGFYSALVAAGSMTFEDGIKAVKTAGELALARGGSPGAMGAVIGLDIDDVEGLCREASAEGAVWVSNVNAARQILVSGTAVGVGRAVVLAQEMGALSAYRLDMGAAYHSPMMEEAVDAFRGYLRGMEFRAPLVPVLSYIVADYARDEAGIRETVARQLSSRVLWKDSVLRLVRDGVDSFIEAGPGSALSRMVRWVDRDVRVTPAESLLKAPASL